MRPSDAGIVVDPSGDCLSNGSRKATFITLLTDSSTYMAVLWLDDIGSEDLETVGGKAASLGELHGADLPVPPAFVVSPGTDRRVTRGSGVAAELFRALPAHALASPPLAGAGVGSGRRWTPGPGSTGRRAAPAAGWRAGERRSIPGSPRSGAPKATV